MDNERAMIILSAYCSSGKDAEDPVFSEALSQAGRDPELSRWLAAERSFDEKMRAAIQSFHSPENFKNTLLLIPKISRISTPRKWSSALLRPTWLAAAAVLLLCLGFGIFSLREKGEKLTLMGIAHEISLIQRSEEVSLGKMTDDPMQVQHWLRENAGPHQYSVSKALGTQSPIGCQVLDIRGNKVSLICFQVPGGDAVHLFVIDRGRLADADKAASLMLHEEGDYAFATWADQKHAYVLTGHGRAESLRRWL